MIPITLLEIALAAGLAAVALYLTAIAAVLVLWETRNGVLLVRQHSSPRHQGWTRLVVVPSPGMGLRLPMLEVETRLWKIRDGSSHSPSTAVGEYLDAHELPRALLLFCSPRRMM